MGWDLPKDTQCLVGIWWDQNGLAVQLFCPLVHAESLSVPLPAPSWFTEPAFVGGGGSFLQPTQPLATWAHILLDA